MWRFSLQSARENPVPAWCASESPHKHWITALTCILRKIKDETPAQFPPDRSFTYGAKTSNTSKRSHIEKYHLDIYLEEAEKNGWAIWLEAVRTAFDSGYNFQTLRQALAAPNASIRSLPALNRGRRDMSSPASGHVTLESGLPPFSIAALQQYLMQFIVADDQVRRPNLNVVGTFY